MFKAVIYRLRDTIGGGEYIGSAVSGPARRWASHRHMLRRGKHHSRTLQGAYDMRGEDAIAFEVLQHVETATEDGLLAAEQVWINLRRADGVTLFNVAPITGTRRGVPQPASFVEKIRSVHAGKPKSAETRAKMSAAKKGKPKSEAHKAKLAEAGRRQMADPARMAASREGAKKQWADPELRAKGVKAATETFRRYWSDSERSAAAREQLSRRTAERNAEGRISDRRQRDLF